jgi:hypothetical protein
LLPATKLTASRSGHVRHVVNGNLPIARGNLQIQPADLILNEHASIIWSRITPVRIGVASRGVRPFSLRRRESDQERREPERHA